MPTIDCLPFYYAEKSGMFKALNSDIKIKSYHAQMDCDTAFTRGHIDVSYTDIIRSAILQFKGHSLRFIMGTDGSYELISGKDKKINDINELEKKIVAIARHSVSDFLLDTIIGKTSLSHDDVFHPQINDISIRHDMLANGTIDAALLPAPYSTQAKLSGHISLYCSDNDSIKMMGIMATNKCLTDSTKLKSLNSLLYGYDQAIKLINEGKSDTLLIKQILSEFHLQPKVSDSINIPHYSPRSLPEYKNVSMALDFLRRRTLIGPEYSGDTLLYEIKPTK